MDERYARTAMACPSAFYLGNAPGGGAAVLLGMGCGWVLGVAQSLWWGFRLFDWAAVGSWLLALLPHGSQWHC